MNNEKICNYRQSGGECALARRVEKTEKDLDSAFKLIDKKAPYWVLLILSTFFLSIAAGVHYQSQDIKERVIVLQTEMKTIK